MNYQLVCEQSSEFGERNDCSVKAVAIATGICYASVHEIFKKHGRKDCDGTTHSTFKAALAELGYTFDTIYFKKAKTMMKVEWEMIFEQRLLGKPAIIESTRHHAAWDGRHVQDWSADRRKRLKCGYVLKPL